MAGGERGEAAGGLSPARAAGRTSVGALYRHRARACGAGTALIEGDRRLTHAALDARSDRLAQALAVRGVHRGERVALLARNCIEYVEVELACAKLGAIVAALNWRLAGRELEHCVNLVEPRVLIHQAEFGASLERLTLAPHERLVLGTEYEVAIERAAAGMPETVVDPEDGLVILYTSGTTGLPKGALISHRAMIARGLCFGAELAIPPGDTFVAWPPMYHMASTDQMLSTLLRGGTVVVVDGFQSGPLLDAIAQWRMGWFILIPGMVEAMIAALRARPVKPAGIGCCGAMADLVPRQQIAEVSALLGAPYLNSFGSTETGLPPATGALIPAGVAPERLSKRQSAFCEIRLVDADGDEVPEGAPGELAIRAPTLFSGYWNAPETNAKDFRDGWFHMGDVFRRNPDGTLDFVDRVKYMIKSGGENIYPAEIEQVILADPRVADAVVVRKTDARWGEVPVAFVARRDPALDADAILARCREMLSGYKQPKAVHFIALEDFPRSTSGKIQRHTLEARLESETGTR
ncbi:MAG: AMP-binding protein [Burkholderiales bacterium]|nr:AMP-binding protein [Burkholderiales bacterium]